MARKIAWTVFGVLVEALMLHLLRGSILAIVVSLVVTILFLVWTWEGLPDWVAKHQADDALTTLGTLLPPRPEVPLEAVIQLPPNESVKPVDTVKAELVRVNIQSRPEVILRYEPPRFSSIRPGEAPTTPLLIQNAGDRPARQIEIDPVFFHGYVARFQPPTELIQNEPSREVQVFVTSTDDENTQGTTLGFALDHDFWHRAWKGDRERHPRWPISLRYRDAIGTAYEDVFELAYDHAGCQVTLGLRSRP